LIQGPNADVGQTLRGIQQGMHNKQCGESGGLRLAVDPPHSADANRPETSAGTPSGQYGTTTASATAQQIPHASDGVARRPGPAIGSGGGHTTPPDCRLARVYQLLSMYQVTGSIGKGTRLPRAAARLHRPPMLPQHATRTLWAAEIEVVGGGQPASSAAALPSGERSLSQWRV
jgi:hypothetical protein